jgi:hypothetical protein
MVMIDSNISLIRRGLLFPYLGTKSFQLSSVRQLFTAIAYQGTSLAFCIAVYK